MLDSLSYSFFFSVLQLGILISLHIGKHFSSFGLICQIPQAYKQENFVSYSSEAWRDSKINIVLLDLLSESLILVSLILITTPP